LRCFQALALSLALARAAHAEAPPATDEVPLFRVSENLSLEDLLTAVRDGDPELSRNRRAVALADADAQQARLLGNPTFDAAWSTIPVGRTNPPNLSRPLAYVPNYGVGVSYTFPLAKRSPRRHRADAMARGSRAELEFQTRDQALQLAEVLGGLATATMRREGVSELMAGGLRAAELAEARLQAQFGSGLDVDQLRIDVDRTEQLLLGASADILENLAACTSLVGKQCTSFTDATSARAFLTHWLLQVDGSQVDLAQRADLRALQAYGDAASAERDLATAQKIPDPTLRLGYLRDQFTISGNQLNSVNVGVSMPLPSFDYGQAQKRAAEASSHYLAEERDKRLAAARTRIPVLKERRELSLERCQRLATEVIPKARAVLANLEKAVEGRLLPMMQVIQSRRVVSELFIEEAQSCGDAYLAALELVREMPSDLRSTGVSK